MPTEINGYSPSEEAVLSSLIINEVDSNETFEKMKKKGLLQDNQLYLVNDEERIDETPTEGSKNLVYSGGVWTAIQEDSNVLQSHIANTSNPHGVTAKQVGLGNVGNFKAVSTVASQGLTDTEKTNARANIGAGTSSLVIGTTASTAAAGNHTHTAANVGAVPTSRTVNGKALNANITLAASDVGSYSKSETDTLLQDKAAKTHASQHSANGSDPITPAAIGAVAKSGGTMTGALTISKRDYPDLNIKNTGSGSTTKIRNSAHRTQIMSQENDNNYRVLTLNDKSVTTNPSSILQIEQVENGSQTAAYNVYHTGYKPSLNDIGAAASNHNHHGMSINPSSIELSPSTPGIGHGGYIDFHFNGDAADYTSRIYEPVKGVLRYNDHGILSTANIVALLNVSIKFTNGVATYENSAIKSSSVTFVQWRAGAVNTLTDSVLSTTPQNGSMKIIAKSGITGGPLPVNILIINL